LYYLNNDHIAVNATLFGIPGELQRDELVPPKMASSNPNDNVVSGPPAKRQKMSPSTVNTTQPDKDVKMDDRKTQLVVSDNGFQFEREAQVGVLHFVNLSNPGFAGTLKQRYVFARASILPLRP
jgi:hypothetical protein